MENRNHLKTRIDKIKFLSGLINGQRDINEIIPGKVLFFFNDDGHPDYFPGHERVNPWSKQEIDKYQERHPQDQVIIFRYCHPPAPAWWRVGHPDKTQKD